MGAGETGVTKTVALTKLTLAELVDDGLCDGEVSPLDDAVAETVRDEGTEGTVVVGEVVTDDGTDEVADDVIDGVVED